MQGPMNCSESLRIQVLLNRLWQELHGGGGGGAAPNAIRRGSSLLDESLPTPSQAAAAGSSAGADDAYLYILLIMIFYGCLAGGLILAYTRSRKLESKHDPYHLYIESDWTSRAGSLGRGGGGPGAKLAVAAEEPSLGEGMLAAASGERRSSGDDSEHL